MISVERVVQENGDFRFEVEDYHLDGGVVVFWLSLKEIDDLRHVLKKFIRKERRDS